MSEREAAAPANVAALVEALDQRARQAGSEGATTVVRGVLASVAESLSRIESRLERLEERVAERAAEDEEGATSALVDQVQGGLGAFNSRLARLEEAFIQAVEDSGPEAVVDQVRSAVEEIVAGTGRTDPEVGAALAALAAQMPALQEAVERGPARLGAIEEALEAVREELTGLVHKEAELLTQRVAALSVAVETTRSVLDGHVEETANSLGRKATEAGRRLAADLGLRRRAEPDDAGAARRQLGRGSSR
jgi:hypothetical protein